MANCMNNDTEFSSEKLFFSELAETKVLSAEEERQLGSDIRENRNRQQAIDRLVGANIRLVASIASRYSCDGMDKMELINEGYFGLVEAASKFDVTRGFRFSTMATLWIKKAVRRAIIKRGYMIYIPEKIRGDVFRLKKLQGSLSIRLGHEPSVAELAKELDTSEKRVEELLSYSRSVASMDAPVNEDGDICLCDTVEDRNNALPDDLVSQEDLRSCIADALDMLPEREATVLRYRYGFYDRIYTLAEVAEIYELSRERIRQIEEHALNAIRRNRECHDQLECYR